MLRLLSGRVRHEIRLLPNEYVRRGYIFDSESKTRVMEDEFIAPSGTDVTDAFCMYLRPLLGSGMPDAFRLRHHPVAKVLRGVG